ncbi:MAG: hypothetical protein ACYDH9_07020 [Limisphaerales bacterium]
MTGQPESMKEFHQRRPPTFFWQGFFILLPVCVLAIIGLLSLRQDRVLAEQEAKQRAATNRRRPGPKNLGRAGNRQRFSPNHELV